MLIAIDGPAGSGKSTVARALAERLRMPHIDTGAIYRALTLKSIRSEVSPDDGEMLAELAGSTKIELDDGKVLLDGEDVTVPIRSGPVTELVSAVSVHPEVRKKCVEIQRALIPPEGAVVEGRDIGTVVLPQADVKIFLTAAPTERAVRRAAELRADGVEVGVDDVFSDLEQRDERDSRRSASPLYAASDAVTIDSTELSPDEVVDEILRLAGLSEET